MCSGSGCCGGCACALLPSVCGCFGVFSRVVLPSFGGLPSVCVCSSVVLPSFCGLTSVCVYCGVCSWVVLLPFGSRVVLPSFGSGFAGLCSVVLVLLYFCVFFWWVIGVCCRLVVGVGVIWRDIPAFGVCVSRSVIGVCWG